MLENEYEGLDEMFKSGLESSRMSPPPGVWEGVSASIAGTGAGVGTGIGIFGKVILGVAVSAGLGVGAYFYVQGEKEKPQMPKENKQEIAAAPATVQEEVQADPVKPIEKPHAPTVMYVVPDIATNDRPRDEVWPGEKEIDNPYYGMKTTEPVNYYPEPDFAGETNIAPCGHKASISMSKLADDRYLFTLNFPEKASNITWYVNGVAEYAGEVNSRSLDKVFTDAAGSTFAVKAKIRSGNCWDSAVQQVKVVVPEPPKEPSRFAMPYNFFSPDGDGLNEYFEIEIANHELFDLNIYDQNKRQIFHSDSPDTHWTGKCGAKDCPAGTYLAVVNYRFKGETENRRKSMYVTLKR